jgi:hypothetical protein
MGPCGFGEHGADGRPGRVGPAGGDGQHEGEGEREVEKPHMPLTTIMAALR